MADERALAEAARAWPFEEARKIAERIGGKAPPKGYVLFETGYGPSGLPHIGTFGEVVRTTMARHAFQRLCPDVSTRLFAFSDDMDGLRKVPDNVPNRDMMSRYIGDKARSFGTPLTSIPDPFGEYQSFGHHNNARLRGFLDQFGFEYEFISSTEAYKSGRFDATLLALLKNFDAVLQVILPTLGPERRATYCPFLPIRQRDGRLQVLEIPAVEVKPDAGTIIFEDAVEGRFEQPVTGGHCKLQWKADWAMRWAALGVDYEMSGKDLIESVRLSSQICRILGARPPEGFTYELFLDEKGEKISKSKGNGLAVEDWLKYAPPESLSLFMYQQPRRAKRLFFDVIPKAVDEYLGYLDAFAKEDAAQQRENPAWHIHDGDPPRAELPLTFGILLNLASVVNAESKDVLWGFIANYRAGASPAKMPILDRLVGYALVYYRDFVKPAKQYRAPTDLERAALADLEKTLAAVAPGTSAEDIQNQVYEVGKRHGFANLRDWFKAQYEVLLGQSQGPRMGTFIALYGLDQTRALIRRALAGENLAAA
ncbi:MAG TPA: lysine--tRNA ligase [Alphaproteobacteria bacterium]|jgi:lysyl-tRNA synthetase class 1